MEVKRRKGFRLCPVCEEAEEYWCRAVFEGHVVSEFPSVLRNIKRAEEENLRKIEIQDGYSCPKCKYRKQLRQFQVRLC